MIHDGIVGAMLDGACAVLVILACSSCGRTGLAADSGTTGGGVTGASSDAPEGCEEDCATQSCTVNCPGGNCQVSCQGACTVTSPAGNCSVSCGDATQPLTQCASGRVACGSCM